MKLRLAFGVVLLVLGSTAVAQSSKDAKGCKDSTLITRFPGTWIVGCKDSAFNTVKVPVQGKPDRELSGETHVLQYFAPTGTAQAEMQANVINALKSAGFTIVADTGRSGRVTANKGNTWYYGAFRGGGYDQTIVVEKSMEQQVVANAEQIGNALNTSGHMIANGILFDTGKADLKPESSAALDEIAKLLKQDADLKIYVVGHTDNQGQLASNMELSKARAAAVVKELTTKYGVAPSRLGSFGCGPYAPVSSNDTDDGRTQNRRVELVKQ